MRTSDTAEATALRTIAEPQVVTEDVPNRQAEVREKFLVDWGTRVTDSALVLHFFPPIQEGEEKIGAWDTDYRIDVRLKHAIDKVLDTRFVTAGYEAEYDSFYVIFGIDVLDPRMLVRKLISEIEAYDPS